MAHLQSTRWEVAFARRGCSSRRLHSCSRRFRGNGQPDKERASVAVLIVPALNLTAVRPHNPIADTQPKTCALACWFRRKEGIKNSRRVGNASPVVADGHFN